MNIFDLRNIVINDYCQYVRSFLRIKDPDIARHVDSELRGGRLWPDPLVQLNPSFAPGATVEELVRRGVLDEAAARIFRRGKTMDSPGTTLQLHCHQEEAIQAAASGGSYVLTTGTGSGKSLSYFIPIVDHVLRHGSDRGIKAIVVYPMNALCNSQLEELRKFLQIDYGDGHEPVRFGRYTGQENAEQRHALAARPPDILLTNFMMLELLMTRPVEDDHRMIEAAKGLEFLVLDELHTYRGRQGADVSLLVRRVRERCGAQTMRCIGTSATMAGAGTWDERRREVSEVATRLFGAEVAPERVIGETLRRAVDCPLPSAAELRTLLERTPDYPPVYEELRLNPLAAWCEEAFGLTTDETGRLTRRQPMSVMATSQKLSDESGTPLSTCQTHLEAVLLAGFAAKNPETGVPLFAFRLHQFVSRGDTVYGTLEASPARYLSLEGQRKAPGADARNLYPMAFCRECGQEYYVTHLVEGRALEPREFGALSETEEVEPGYLMLDPEREWALTTDLAPEDWVEVKRNGALGWSATSRRRRPRSIFVQPDGSVTESDTDGGIAAHFVPTPFRFCLACGVTYGSAQSSDFGKLAELATEGRSTATTVISFSVVRSLRRMKGLLPTARKLLSFTDNRQDASLQAGHFNDFIQVGLLRGALYAAALDSGANGLEHDRLASATFKAMGLDFNEFSSNENVELPAQRRRIEKALCDVINYRIYRDQQRGWRVTSPNLEGTGLLRVDYDDLDELCGSEKYWEQRHRVLRHATPEQRATVCRVLLDYMRRELAIKVECLESDRQESIKSNSYQYLKLPWAFDEDEELLSAGVLHIGPRTGRPSDRDAFVSSRSGLGQYLRRPSTWPESLQQGERLPAEEVEQLAADLCQVLEAGNLVERVSNGRLGLGAYQVQAASMRWLPGDGTPLAPDPARVPRPSRAQAATNEFFREFYETVALTLKGMQAREHTAQVPAAKRQEREHAFRDGSLPILYCSPTMELGVDIADLNAVNLRNVPPTPANYAQRSGRAGRSGQPAFVLTYCSSNSPHDQYFFRRPEAMVYGAVTAPRLDLGNEDLVRSHMHAVWLAETGVSLGESVSNLLDLDGDPPSLELLQSVTDGLMRREVRAVALRRCRAILEGLSDEISKTEWYRTDWIEGVIDGAYTAFNRACDRWRSLFSAASRQREQQHRIVCDNSAGPERRHLAERLRDEAQTQINLLTDSGANSHSDFYSYRYFAGEGFLPGYNFPRLPLSAYLPGSRRRKGGEEFVQRPRFLAVSEFGPQSIIYHEGNRYEVDKVLMPLQDSGERTQTGKFCGHCGYGHFGDHCQDEKCNFCGAPLSGAGTLPFSNLLRLENVSTRRRDRITSDEEERMRQGYELKTAFRFAETSDGRACRKAAYVLGDDVVATAAYAPTATLWRLNLGWRRNVLVGAFGFPLNMDTGRWGNNSTAAAPAPLVGATPTATLKTVIPFVEDRRNALLLELPGVRDPETLASVQYALKRGIQAAFQIEDSELAAEPLPDRKHRRMVLLYEASEGGAGVLSRLVDDTAAMAFAVRAALSLCHFDPDTGEDLHHAPNAKEACQAACYDCILGYNNQLEHGLLDRFKARDVLIKLRDARTEAGAGSKNRNAIRDELLAACGSQLEKRFVTYLYENGYRLPDTSQIYMQEHGTRPDFSYTSTAPAVCLYVDGPPHEYPERQKRDREATSRLEDSGYCVIRVQGDDTWPIAIAENSWLFGSGYTS